MSLISENTLDRVIPSLESVECSQGGVLGTPVRLSCDNVKGKVIALLGPKFVLRKKEEKEMIGLFWNIRGLGLPGRVPALISRIRDNHVDFVGTVETKKSDFTPGFLRSLTGTTPFSWCFLKSKGSADGVLVGANANLFTLSSSELLKFCVSVVLTNKSNGFAFKLIVVYGSPYEDEQKIFFR